MPVPNPTPILRMIHIDNLAICLKRGALHSWNHTPEDGLKWKPIHSEYVQAVRHSHSVTCGPGGVVHDYVPFYFGPLSVMLLNLKTGRVEGYAEGQRPLLYLVSTAQAVVANGCGFIFSDGHGLATYTTWFDNINDLTEVDWPTVNARYWADTLEDMDRQRRKQAEFLVHERCDWSLIQEIVCIDAQIQADVQTRLNEFPRSLHCPVRVERDWYY